MRFSNVDSEVSHKFGATQLSMPEMKSVSIIRLMKYGMDNDNGKMWVAATGAYF